MTRAELMRRMTPSEFIHWQVLYAIEPWGGRRLDIQMSHLSALLATVMQWGKRRKKFKPQDFLLDFWAEAKKQQASHVWNAFRSFASAHNARVKAQEEVNAQETE